MLAIFSILHEKFKAAQQSLCRILHIQTTQQKALDLRNQAIVRFDASKDQYKQTAAVTFARIDKLQKQVQQLSRDLNQCIFHPNPSVALIEAERKAANKVLKKIRSKQVLITQQYAHLIEAWSDHRISQFVHQQQK